VSPPEHPSSVLWRRRMLGGASSVWGGRCMLLDETDLEQDLAGAGAWPIPYRALTDYTSHAAEFLELGEPSFDAPTALYAVARSDISCEQIERYSPPTRIADRYWPALAKLENVTLFTHAPCVEIATEDGARRAAGVKIRPPGADMHFLKARTVIVAAGGLETPRLLLASRGATQFGLGNDRNLVGRYYMTQIIGTVGKLIPQTDKYREAFKFKKTHDDVYVKRNIQISQAARRRERILNVVLRPSIGKIADCSHGSGVLSALYLARNILKNELAANMIRRSVAVGDNAVPQACLPHIANILRDAPGVALFAAHWFGLRRIVTRKLPGLYFLSGDGVIPIDFTGEQAPMRESRVSLSNETDPLGMPRLAISWTSSELDRIAVRRSYDLIRRDLAASGVMRLDVDTEELEAALDPPWPVGGHHLGTARMGASPDQGVVDKDLKVWGTDGLFVAGAAVFPTSGCANPTLSAVALGFRLADHITELSRAAR
jgi:choline dehydrogenase-like flavoprotein